MAQIIREKLFSGYCLKGEFTIYYSLFLAHFCTVIVFALNKRVVPIWFIFIIVIITENVTYKYLDLQKFRGV